MSVIRDVLSDMITLDEELKHYVVKYFELKLNECLCVKNEDFEDRVVEVFDKNGYLFFGKGRCSNGVYGHVLKHIIPALRDQKRFNAARKISSWAFDIYFDPSKGFIENSYIAKRFKELQK